MHKNTKYPIPETFIEEFNNIPNCTIKHFEKKYGVNTLTVKRWAKEANINFIKSNASLEEQFGKEFIIDAVTNCVDSNDINAFCKIHKINKFRLITFCEKHNIPFEHLKGKTLILAPPKKELVLCIEKGMTNQQIEQKYNVNCAVLNRWYRDYNIKRAPYEGTKTPVPSREELVELHINQKRSIKFIANQLETSYIKVSSWLEDYGIEQKRYRPKWKVFLSKEELIDLHINKKMSFADIAKYLKISDVAVGVEAKKFGIDNIDYGIGQTSASELEVLSFIQQYYPSAQKINLLDSLNINIKNPSVSYDICIPEIMLIIEYNGIYFHNEKCVSPNRHFDKMKLAQHHGYQIVNIFSDEWKFKESIVKSILLSKMNMIENKVFARKTSIIEVTTKDANKFYEENHIQGRSTGLNTSYGLVYNNELVSVMSFGRHHRKNNNDVILKRFASKLNTTIIGGAGKLFKHYCNEHPEIKEIKSWSDNRWFNGNIYEKLQFKHISDVEKRYSYVYPNGIRKSAQSHTKKLIGCPSNISERDFLYMQGIYRIWDCGKKTWIWKRRA